MALPNFKNNPNVESNVNRMLENQPFPEIKSKEPTQPERHLELPEKKIEKPETTDTQEKIEIKTEKEGLIDNTIDTLKQKLKRQKPKNKTIPQVRDEMTIQVEKIMEAGLQDAYKALTPVQQQEFKIKGESVAIEIRSLLNSGKIKIKKIIDLIMSWLRLLPGVNKFFLEQEAKIKADKIVALKNFDKK